MVKLLRLNTWLFTSYGLAWSTTSGSVSKLDLIVLVFGIKVKITHLKQDPAMIEILIQVLVIANTSPLSYPISPD